VLRRKLSSDIEEDFAASLQFGLLEWLMSSCPRLTYHVTSVALLSTSIHLPLCSKHQLMADAYGYESNDDFVVGIVVHVKCSGG
jgi:hypothetical protein